MDNHWLIAAKPLASSNIKPELMFGFFIAIEKTNINRTMSDYSYKDSQHLPTVIYY